MTAEDLVADQELETKLNIGARLKVWKWIGRKIPLYQRGFKISARDIIRAARFASYVRLSEYKVPFPVMSVVVWLDYHLRAMPMRRLRSVRRLTGMFVNIFRRTHEEPSKSEGQVKVVTIGGYGHKDIGDEAMPHAVRANLRRQLGDRLELVMLSHDPETTSEMHGEVSKPDFTGIGPGPTLGSKMKALILTAILLIAAKLEKHGIRLRLWPSARAALDEISTADVLLNVGGGNVNSVMPAELYKKCTTYWLADIVGTPVFISGQTMGPFERWLDGRYAAFCLNKTRMISFRDRDTSRERLEQIGVRNPVMFDAADDAITLDGVSASNASKLLKSETGLTRADLDSGLVLFMNLKASLTLFKGIGHNASLDGEVALMAQIADALVETFGCTIIFCPTDFTEGVDDRVYHERIVALMEHKDSVYQITDEHSDDELIGMIGFADAVIGARYHFNVFAAARLVPFVGFASGTYQRTKLEGLANLCEAPDCYVDLELGTADLDEAWPHIVNVVENRQAIQSTLRRSVPEMRERSLRVIEAVVAELDATSRGDRLDHVPQTKE